MSKLRALTMPKWGIEMVEGTIAEWHVKAGDRITKGQVIALVETDKIANDLEAEFDAGLGLIVAEAGSVHPVGALLAVLTVGEASAADIAAFAKSFRAAAGSAASGAAPPAAATPPAADAALVTTATAAPVPATTPAPAPAEPAAFAIPAGTAISPAARARAELQAVDVRGIKGSGRGGRITLQDVDQAAKPAPAPAPFAGAPVSVAVSTDSQDKFFASPYAKRLAAAQAVDLAAVKGTGRHGRIGLKDVMAIAGSGGGASSFTVERFSAMRKAIARQLTLSKSTIPHFYLRMQVRTDAMMALRKKAPAGAQPSVNDYFIRAVGLALAQVPAVNVQVHAEEIHRFAHADIAVAVATDRGLITPIVRAADTKSVSVIGAEIRALAERARAGKLRPEEYVGGSFSVSNLGMFGIDEFDAIINPPQGAILAIGAAKRRTVVDGDSMSFASTVNLSMSCDHRAIDGAVGAQFLSALRDLIESPDSL